ncbi:MAG: TIGR02270 family protein [Cytophagales bacterium]|nr:TIGR02270 family protein [Rhizobacter sp.]
MSVVSHVLAQHLDDAVSLRSVRSVLLREPHVKLKDLARADERLLAHLDGLSIAGDDGAHLSRAALDVPGVGQLFVACVLAIERRDAAQIQHLLSLIDVVPDAPRALSSAFGWVAAPQLRGLTAPLLISPSPQLRWLGLVACVQHRVDAGAPLEQALHDPDLRLRTRALRAAGELGRVDLLESCLGQLDDEQPAVAVSAARSAVLLGDRGEAVYSLRKQALKPGPYRLEALAISLFTADADTARGLVRQLASEGTDTRTMIRAAGWSGDVQVMPWLFKQMESKAQARVAGEAFSFITGIDLAWNHLHRDAPESESPGPNDDPADPDVALDEDENLRWPELPKISTWWHKNQGQFTPGERYFLGALPSSGHCVQALRHNTQRQRMTAAIQLSLLNPGSTLFNCAAPAHRQERLLAHM